MAQCPQCRGDLIDDDENSVWIVVFSTLTTTAADLETDSFAISVLLDDDTYANEDLDDNNGVVSGDRTVYTWTISRPGNPMSGVITVNHDTLGELEETLTVSEMGAAA